MLIETLVATRDVGRLNTIAGVLIRHGLGDVVHRLGLADTLARAMRGVVPLVRHKPITMLFDWLGAVTDRKSVV